MQAETLTSLRFGFMFWLDMLTWEAEAQYYYQYSCEQQAYLPWAIMATVQLSSGRSVRPLLRSSAGYACISEKEHDRSLDTNGLFLWWSTQDMRSPSRSLWARAVVWSRGGVELGGAAGSASLAPQLGAWRVVWMSVLAITVLGTGDIGTRECELSTTRWYW